MSFYKIILQPKTSFITPLRSDIVFGHLCWQILYRDGEQKLKSFLDDFQEKPLFLLSDGFPGNLLPKPITSEQPFKFEPDDEKGDKIEKIKKNKKYKKVNYVPLDLFKEIAEVNNLAEIEQRIEREFNLDTDKNLKKFDYFKKQTVLKNTIDRATNQTIEGGLFEQEEVWTKGLKTEPHCWSIYLRVLNKDKFNEYKIKQRLEEIFTTGYGAKKSTGKGVFAIKFDEKFSRFDNLAGSGLNGSVLLSHCVLTNDEKGMLENSSYKIDVKYGKMGEQKSHSEKPFKKPVIQLCPGSVLKTNKQWVGTMLNLTDLDKNILDYNYGFLLPFKLK